MTSCRRWCRTPLLSLALLVAPILLPAQEPAPAAGQATPAPAAAVLRGRVADLAGRPLAGAEVIARVATGRVAARAVTAEDGRFGLALAAADTGTVTVRAQRIGYRPAERTVRPGDTGAETLALDFALASAPVRLDEVVVTATRSATAVSELPAAVSVIDREEIAAQSAVGVGVGDMLGKTVPGLGAGAQSMSTYGQSLRGRSVTVLVDGVPLSTVRNVSRDLASIDPSVVERIEVVRGASAVYGDGATGGVINVITRTPDAVTAGASAAMPLARFSTEVQMTSSLTHPDGSVGGRVVQGLTAARGPFDVTATAAMGRIGGFFDAAGDRVPSDPHGQGGLAESRSWDAFAKLGLALGGARRLQLTGNWYDLEQQTDFVTLPSAELGKASVREGLELDQPQNAKNGYLSLDYTQPFAGGRAHAQLYYRDYLTRFGPSVRQLRRQEAGDTARVRRAYVTQSFLDSEKGGGRLELETRLGARRGAPSVTWGADYVDERTFQALNVFDRDAWTAGDSLVYRKTDEWMWVPPLHTRSLGLFAQAAWSPVEPLTVRGGIRHERARADVHDFTTIEQVAVTGGALRYRPVLLNAGAVVTPVRGVDVFANFSQGFSLADLGRILRGATSGFILGTHSVDAQLVDQYEVGARATGRQVQASLSLFRNTSALGSTYDAALNVVRAPERVYGLEATLDVQPAARWQVGGTFTWTEGEAFMRRDTLSTDSVWKALGGYRIQPPKVTGYVQHATTPGWTNRVQLLASGRRTRAYEEFLRYAGSAVAGSETPLEAFATLDLLSSLRVGAGTLTLGVENLLNRLYFSTVSQLEQGTAYRAAARGRTLTVGYGVRY